MTNLKTEEKKSYKYETLAQGSPSKLLPRLGLPYTAMLQPLKNR